MKYRVSVIIEKDDKKGYFAFCPELQGCYTQGDTYEVIENIRDAIKLNIEDRRENKEAISHSEIVNFTSLEVTI